MATPPDPRDAALIEAVVAAVRGLVLAVERREPEQVAGEMTKLLHAVIAHNAAIGERPGDEALRRAVAALSVSG
jgi:hypothetical protein